MRIHADKWYSSTSRSPTFVVYRTPTIIPCRINRFHTIVATVTSSIVDMFERVNGHPEEAALCRRVHQSFQKLEKSAALILSVLDTACGRGRASINWSRAEVNILRKFLFIVGSRNTLRWRRFAHYGGGESGVLDEEQNQEIERFRAKHGQRSARCAWLFSLQNLLETPHWKIPTNDKILPEDRTVYEEDLRFRQLAIYEAPRDRGCEFSLTDSSLGVGEGITTLLEDDEEWEECFGQCLNIPRPSSSDKQKKAARAVPLVKIYTVSPHAIIVLAHIQMTLSDEPALAAPNPSALAGFPQATTRVTYIPPLSAEATSFSNKNPSLWTPEDIQRESDFRHDNILDGKVVYSRLSDRMEFKINVITMELFRSARTVILRKFDRWLVTKTPDGMKEIAKEKQQMTAIEEWRRTSWC